MKPTNRCEMKDLGEGAELGLAWQQSLSVAADPRRPPPCSLDSIIFIFKKACFTIVFDLGHSHILSITTTSQTISPTQASLVPRWPMDVQGCTV